MSFVIVPNELRDAINKKLDAALAETPDATADRKCFYQHLLGFYNLNGFLPEFTLAKRDAPARERGDANVTLIAS